MDAKLQIINGKCRNEDMHKSYYTNDTNDSKWHEPHGNTVVPGTPEARATQVPDNPGPFFVRMWPSSCGLPWRGRANPGSASGFELNSLPALCTRARVLAQTGQPRD